uniref:Uncharacterized protein n=1 Tax=Chenopodium quinoa TaxID=63459 RepID=A0A803MVY5_CHEQI
MTDKSVTSSTGLPKHTLQELEREGRSTLKRMAVRPGGTKQARLDPFSSMVEYGNLAPLPKAPLVKNEVPSALRPFNYTPENQKPFDEKSRWVPENPENGYGFGIGDGDGKVVANLGLVIAAMG